ncbi:efflux RND transporter periplasmic adaptor subunit [Rhodobacteraceae bacterium NNCM2]|nr:efflux RND transporter periplasmic adaptor subunit [Coraliihabitans acroporae]
MPVDVARPLSAKIVDWDEFTGRFEAVQRVEIRARVSGYLEEVLFRDGQLVEKGQVLYKIDPKPFEAEYARAMAELSSAEAEAVRARVELERGQQLVQTRTVAESTLDQRVATKLRAEAQVAVAEAAVRTARLSLDYTEIKAPFAGRISDNQVDAGNLVLSGETLLATVVTTDPIHLVFTASEADFLKYTRLSLAGALPSSRNSPNEVDAKLIDEDDWSYTGAMNFLDNEFDPNAGTITGRAIFDNPDGILTPGLFARLRLIGSGEYEALLLPDSAIMSDQTRKIVMVIDEENTVSPRIVELGPLFKGLRVVRSGLEPNDRVVVNGIQRARPGGKVVPEETVISFDEPTN